MSANTHGYGIHGLRHDECPNCGAATEWYSFTTPGAGVNCKRCPRCAPWWLEIVAPLSALAVMVAVFCGWSYWVFGGSFRFTAAVSVSAGLLVAVRIWPRIQGAKA